MRFVVTVLFWAVFVASAPICFALGALIWLVGFAVDRRRNGLHLFLCYWTHAYLKLNPAWDVKVEHRERVPRGASVFVANHQSMADIVAVMGLHRPFKFVSKSSLFSLPVVGWLMSMARYVSVVRGRPKSMHQMMEACRIWLRRGVPVLIFPEGTYSPDGKLLPFKRGAFSLAIEEKVPLVPVIIEGTPSLVYEDGPWLSPRCRIRVRVLEPLPVDSLGTDDAALTQRVRALYETTLGQSPRPALAHDP